MTTKKPKDDNFFHLTPEMITSNIDLNVVTYVCTNCGLKSLVPSECEACHILRIAL